ncbi:MAG TPA: hypothetical protein VN317_01975 [Candidatus Methanoperedens sp.]|nr:hypothetical protein [Candidatus Methanoperedens sp.]
MTRVRLFVLAAVMLTGLAGCGGGNDADPVGRWNAGFAHNCDGNYHKLTFRFFDGGGFRDSASHSGSWTVDGDTLRVSVSNGYVFSGTIGPDTRMSGKYTAPGKASGCWNAERASTTP